MKSFERICWAAVFALGAGFATAMAGEPLHVSDSSALLGQAEVQTEPAATLRGFGKLEATFRSFPAHKASILVLTCEDVAKAKLTLAKYLSDLQVLPGVKAALIGSQPGYLIAGQGAVVAFRAGTSVCILAADNAATVKALARECVTGERTSFKYSPEISVPMWLDRWDRFGFRFYYSYPGSTPPGQTAKTYDFSKEFEYAEKMQRAGLLFWVNAAPMDGAEDQIHSSIFDWALDEAERRHLPVGMQLGLPNAETWLSNRMREETAQKMPDFVGDRYSPASDFDGGQGAISWSSEPGNALMNGLVVDMVKHFNSYDCITSWLEPHSELKHGDHDILMEYGPVADKTFREFLRGKYGTDVTAVSRRWTGKPDSLRSWDDVHVPELASFLGWGGDAISLKGDWKVKFYEPEKEGQPEVIPAPETWALPTTPDADWPTVVAPGHDRTMFLPKKPATYRRTFTVPPEWIHPGEKVWIYVWDLSPITKHTVVAYLNGQEIGRSPVLHATPHWAAYEASAVLKPGDNQLSLYLPMGYIAYRAYLSRHAPVQYPNLEPGQNALWADFADWTLWSRSRAVRNTALVVRQADPDRGMSFAAPDAYSEQMRQVCEEVGGEFHNTGYMGAFWAEYLPMLMRSAGLPMSVEPGGPAATLDDFKYQLGLWETEGIQGIDYFIHIGSILWNEPIKKHFEEHQNEIRLVGKCHVPRADLGVLVTNRIASLVGWPWGADLNTSLEAGYWRFNPSWYLRENFERDGVTPSDFNSGRADRYRVIIDTNTSVMDEAMVSGIERYVRQGGVFVTYVQTGRHTPEQKDAWPIERLTGYHVLRIDQLDAKGQAQWRALKAEPGQQIFTGDDWKTFPKGNGLMMEKKAADCVDILRWTDDDTVAMGMRPLGKGWIVEVGAKFAHDRIWSGDTVGTQRFFCAILDHFGVPRIPAALSAPNNDYYKATEPGGIPPMTAHALPLTMRHYQSNNGLYDLWVMWNSKKEPTTASLTFAKGFVPASCLEARQWTPVALTTVDGQAALTNLHFDPLETRVFMTPRSTVAQAPLDWLHLQQGWWRGAADPSVQPPPPVTAPKFSVPLDDGWSFRALSEKEDAAPYLASDAPATGWEQRRIGIVSFKPDGPRRGVFRRSFVVPGNWTGGRREFWLTNWHPGAEFHDQGHVYLDGKPLLTRGATDDLTTLLAPGSRHTVAVEVTSTDNLMGIEANVWLQWLPPSVASQDLAGDWNGSKDFLTYDLPLKLPGDWKVTTARRNVVIDAAQKGRTVMIRAEGRAAPLGVIINGRWLRRHHHFIGDRLEINITPWVRFGESNEIELVGRSGSSLTAVALRFYDRGTYP